MVWRFLFRRLLLIAPLLLFIPVLHLYAGPDRGTRSRWPCSPARSRRSKRSRRSGPSSALTKPMFTQFWIYIQKVAQGDLGESWFSKRPVMTDLVRRAPVTLELLLWGVGLGALIGVPVGLRAARRRGRAFDQIVRFVSLLGFSTPTYWLGLVMILVFFFYLGWAPPAMGRIDLIISSPPRCHRQLSDRRPVGRGLGSCALGLRPPGCFRSLPLPLSRPHPSSNRHGSSRSTCWRASTSVPPRPRG